MAFAKDFVWGAATASYQIEGAVAEDGRGESVWDTYCKRPGAIWENQSGEVACDHYHHWKEDVALMRKIGLKAYRFSIAWPRVVPDGVGAVNPRGLAFYDRLVDELLAAGIEPWPTLFHWDMPQGAFDRGGWLNRESADWFADYATAVVDALGDRVRSWFTLNEPQCFIGFGHRDSLQAPGLKLSRSEWLRAGHHALLAHGRAVQVIRSRAKGPCRVSWAPVGWSKMPATANRDDIDAAREATFAVTDEMINNAWWMDPVYLGRYPQDGLRLYGADAPKVLPGDMDLIAQPLDLQAFNTYNGQLIRRGADGRPELVPHPTGYPMNFFHGSITPPCLYWTAKFMYERYRLPVVISENGMSNADWVGLDGRVPDGPRIDMLRRYLLELERAADEGVPVAGYFLWSLMDNFEWSHGYKQRFGIIHVDFVTGRRTLKDSALWYRDVIATHGGKLHEGL
ncbi:MAG: beta-glucosidase [Phycisphaerae bacterium]|nr:beta-glucosidase [Phycisphaerae bacterium]